MAQQLFVFGARDEQIFVLLIDGADGRNEVSNVRADAEVAQPPAIDRDPH
jgi:hypothetical protein